MSEKSDRPKGPIDPLQVPRFAGPSTFARLPAPRRGRPLRRRRGGRALRQRGHLPARRPLRPDRGAPGLAAAARLPPRPRRRPLRRPAGRRRGRHRLHPVLHPEAIAQIEAGADALLARARHFLAIGGDHTISLPLLRAFNKRHGPAALLHFDAHLDTWDTYFGASYTHGTPFRRAFEEGLLLEDHSMHVGIRGPLFSPQDLVDDAGFGFRIVTAMDFEELGIAGVVERVRAADRRRAALRLDRHRRARSGARPRARVRRRRAGSPAASCWACCGA